MDSSVSGKDEIWFLRMCHHVPHELYLRLFNTGFYYTKESECACTAATIHPPTPSDRARYRTDVSELPRPK